MNNKIFPTIFLATVYGACNIIGRLVTILSPEIARIPPPTPMIIMIIFSTLSAFVSFFLKRTKLNEE